MPTKAGESCITVPGYQHSSVELQYRLWIVDSHFTTSTVQKKGFLLSQFSRRMLARVDCFPGVSQHQCKAIAVGSQSLQGCPHLQACASALCSKARCGRRGRGQETLLPPVCRPARRTQAGTGTAAAQGPSEGCLREISTQGTPPPQHTITRTGMHGMDATNSATRVRTTVRHAGDSSGSGAHMAKQHWEVCKRLRLSRQLVEPSRGP